MSMTEVDCKPFIEYLAGLVSSGIYARQEISTEGFLLYWAALKDECDLTTFQRALMAHVKDTTPARTSATAHSGSVVGDFFPKPADIKKQIDLILQRNCNPMAAWTKVELAIRQHGKTRSLDFQDPAIHAAIQSLGGWIYLCQKLGEESEYSFRRAFMESYESAHVARLSGPALLLGEIDSHNLRLNSEHKVRPVRIGLPKPVSSALLNK